jgi:hypothetical protein
MAPQWYELLSGKQARRAICYALLLLPLLCHAMLCYAMLCYAMLCYAMPCHATSVDARVCADTVPSAYRPMSAFMPDTMPLDATPEHGQRVLLVLAFTTPRSRHFRPGTTVGHRIGWRPGTVLNHCPECHCAWPDLGVGKGGGRGGRIGRCASLVASSTCIPWLKLDPCRRYTGTAGYPWFRACTLLRFWIYFPISLLS